jgi:hypothetical protein
VLAKEGDEQAHRRKSEWKYRPVRGSETEQPSFVLGRRSHRVLDKKSIHFLMRDDLRRALAA